MVNTCKHIVVYIYMYVYTIIYILYMYIYIYGRFLKRRIPKSMGFNTVLVLDELEVPPLQETSRIYQEYVVNEKKN
jgi:hypothetical protein